MFILSFHRFKEWLPYSKFLIEVSDLHTDVTGHIQLNENNVGKDLNFNIGLTSVGLVPAGFWKRALMIVKVQYVGYPV